MAYLNIKRSDLKFGDELGKGHYGMVYQATWRQSLWKRQEVAVKRLHNIQKRDIHILPQLQHSSIVKVLGVVDEKPDLFLVMELCEGGSVRQYLTNYKGTRLPFEKFCNWIKQAVIPINYLKEIKVAYRNIKTPNYFIAGDGHTLKLADFGFAMNANSIASYAWMAPELFTDSELSLSYDIFSFGVVIWELWTTEIPHKDVAPRVIGWRVCNQNLTLSIPEDCPQPIADLMRQCWDADWEKRPSFDHVTYTIDNLPPSIAVDVATTKAARQTSILQGQWVLDKKIEMKDVSGRKRLPKPREISVNPSGDIIAIANQWHSRVELFTRDMEYMCGHSTSQDMKRGELSQPTAVEFTSDDTYYVTDKLQFVKKYSVDGGFKGKWAAVSPQNRRSNTEETELKGLCMDNKRQLLVGAVTKKLAYISRHKLDGCHIASFDVDITPSCLAVTSQDAIIISDWNGAAQITDTRGQLLHVLQVPGFVPLGHPERHLLSEVWDPAGVTCHEDLICICCCVDKAIHCFSVSGEYLGRIPIWIEHWPSYCAFTPDGRQLILSYFSFNDTVSLYKLQR